MPHRNWFHISARAAGTAEILIYDEISSKGGVTAKDFDVQLKALGAVRELVLRINSPGGETATAASIINMLERLKAGGAKVTVWIDGIAASAASWIAMVGDEVIMPENSMMMIHDPAGLVVGTADDMRDLASVLDKVRAGMVTTYAAKSGKSRAAIEKIMADETWFTAQEAVDAGFADRVAQPVAIAARFDLTKRYHRPAPTSMAELAQRFWAGKGVAVAPDAIPASVEAKTLVPRARHDAIWSAHRKEAGSK